MGQSPKIKQPTNYSEEPNLFHDEASVGSSGNGSLSSSISFGSFEPSGFTVMSKNYTDVESHRDYSHYEQFAVDEDAWLVIHSASLEADCSGSGSIHAETSWSFDTIGPLDFYPPPSEMISWSQSDDYHLDTGDEPIYLYLQAGIIYQISQYSELDITINPSHGYDGASAMCFNSVNYEILPIPEPTTVSLLALAGLAMLRSRKNS